MIVNIMLIRGIIFFIIGVVGMVLAFSVHVAIISISFLGFFISGIFYWLSQLPDPLDEFPNGSEWALQNYPSESTK